MKDDRLTIRVTGKQEAIPFDSFLKIAQSALEVLHGLDAKISRDQKPSVRWQIERITMSSPLTMVVFGESIDTETDISSQVIQDFRTGLESMEAGTYTIPPNFTIGTLESLKDMVSVLEDGVADVTVMTPNTEPVKPTQRTAQNVQALIGPDEYVEYTTVEGRLEMLSVHGGRNFNIYDVLHKTRIACHFPSTMIETAKNAFNQRIEVTGKARYKRNGLPFSVQVENIRILKEKHQLPQFKDLEKIGITGGLGAAEYIRRLNDAD